jgi:predicted RNA binding protein YcfA (HicA-like mRNA interferase family)
MPKLPIMKAKDFYGYLLKYGCEHVSVNSSHFKVRWPKTNRPATVPIHGGKDIGKGLFADILSQLGIDVDDFLEFIAGR